jgi:hypothetical protein
MAETTNDQIYDIYVDEFQRQLGHNEANGDGFKAAMLEALRVVYEEGRNDGYWEGRESRLYE